MLCYVSLGKRLLLIMKHVDYLILPDFTGVKLGKTECW